ncbi:MAG: hypothetical protein LBI19_08455 [Oscillospiraceae bacterium]|nr:hypothetical protein [Oscillospiraceae bacterium]
MGKNSKILHDDTLIVWNKHPVGEYRKYFQQATGKEEIVTVCRDFQTWLFTQAGKTLKEALEELNHPSGSKNMEELLTERRFDMVSGSDKAFIIAFDKAIHEFGYDFGGAIGSGNVWSLLVVAYGKTGTKSRPCAARIYIRDAGSIMLRLYMRKVDAHRQYVENAPSYIKEAFTSGNGNCTFCWDKCPARPAAYTIDGQLFHKCQHGMVYFNAPSVEKLPDYMGLFSEFYPVKTK